MVRYPSTDVVTKLLLSMSARRAANSDDTALVIDGGNIVGGGDMMISPEGVDSKVGVVVVANVSFVGERISAVGSGTGTAVFVPTIPPVVGERVAAVVISGGINTLISENTGASDCIVVVG